MSDPTETNPDPKGRLEAAMAEYLMAADTGLAPDATAFLARYPDLHAELAEFIADQAGLVRLVEPLRATPAAPLAVASAVTLPLENAGQPGDATASGTISTTSENATSDGWNGSSARTRADDSGGQVSGLPSRCYCPLLR